MKTSILVSLVSSSVLAFGVSAHAADTIIKGLSFSVSDSGAITMSDQPFALSADGFYDHANSEFDITGLGYASKATISFVYTGGTRADGLPVAGSENAFVYKGDNSASYGDYLPKAYQILGDRLPLAGTVITIDATKAFNYSVANGFVSLGISNIVTNVPN